MKPDPKHLENWLQKPSSPVPEPGDPVAGRLQRAAAAGESLEIRYLGGSSPGSLRRIRPLRVYERAGSVYVDAHCETRGETRCFKVSRIDIPGIRRPRSVVGSSRPTASVPAKTGGSGCLVMLLLVPSTLAGLLKFWFTKCG